MTQRTAEPLRTVRADMHIHTCLSPCATLDMTPIKIVRKALEENLAIIAVTDHNSAENVAAVIAAARESDLHVIPGIEVTTAEEAHIIGFFKDAESALLMQDLIYKRLLPGENDEELFGLQVIANRFDEVEGINKRLLIGATSLLVDEVVAGIHNHGGLAVAAHIDRSSFSLIGQLGFIPEGLGLDAVEISKRITLAEARVRYPEYEKMPFITASDAHDLEEIGTSPVSLCLAGYDQAEFKLAFQGMDGRRII